MNENKFTNRAEVYDKVRPSYPSEAIDYILSIISTNRIIADIGSGTGILTELLLKRGYFVYAVEPNEDMRTVAEKKLSGYEKFVSINATAEKTLLPNHYFDAVTVAQALHWFDLDKFRCESKRILKKNGVIFIFDNMIYGTLADELSAILKIYCPNFNGLNGGLIKEHLKKISEKTFNEKIFEWKLIYNEEKFIGSYVSSAGYAPNSNEQGYDELIFRLHEFFEKYQQNGEIIFPNRTKIYSIEKRQFNTLCKP